jgi:[1-hydroxy-2-(trimethylamino)ethyl]phosphonate dioxygenase
MSVSTAVLDIFRQRGSGAYFGERVSMTEHALQAAHFAQTEAAPPQLIVAALLHDIGHLLDDVPGDIADWTVDAHHEQTGSDWLARRFGPEVSEPVRLHVPAKRYLLATDPEYFARLSPASVITLKLQGGPMAAHEVSRFESERYYREAVRVRHWDDRGKVSGLRTPRFEDYCELIETLARQTAKPAANRSGPVT